MVGTIGRLLFGSLAMALKDITCVKFLGKDKKYLRLLPVQWLVLSGRDLRSKTCSSECWILKYRAFRSVLRDYKHL